MDDSTDLASSTTPPPPSSSVRRRNSIATSTMVPIRNKPSPLSLVDFQLVSLESPLFSYTSLKDVLPPNSATINSPSVSSVTVSSGYEISIRNRLVKQAAWAYLQPMSSSPVSSTGADFIRRLWERLSFSFSSLSACVTFITQYLVSGIIRIFIKCSEQLGANKPHN